MQAIVVKFYITQQPIYMKQSYILNVHRDLSIPWFEQINKEVLFPWEDEPQIYYSIKPPDYVTALTSTDDGRFVILKQFRPAIEDHTFELPSGHLEDGETPEQAMMRELNEETGCEGGTVTLLGELMPDTGRLENTLWPFYINDVVINELPDPAGNEGIEVVLVTREKLFQMIQEGRFHHSHDLAVIALALLNKHLKL